MRYYVLDLDGPIYPFLANLGPVASKYTGRPVEEFKPHQETWSGFMDDWGISVEEFLTLFALGVHNENLLWEGDAVTGAVNGWLKLATDPDQPYIHVVTDRNPFAAVNEAHEATNYWIAGQGLYYDAISFRGDKVDAVRENIAAEGLVEADLEIFTIEDKPENITAYQSAGWNSYAFDLPCNRHLNVPRVATLEDFSQV